MEYPNECHYCEPTTAPTQPSKSVITAMAYNNHVGSGVGGEGEGQASDAELEVVPRGGTVVVFPSRTVPHEVLPSRKPRLAATLWFVSSSLLQPDAPSDEASDAADHAADRAMMGASSSSGRSPNVGSSSFTASWNCQGDARALFGGVETSAVGLEGDPGTRAGADADSGSLGGDTAATQSTFSFGF